MFCSVASDAIDESVDLFFGVCGEFRFESMPSLLRAASQARNLGVVLGEDASIERGVGTAGVVSVGASLDEARVHLHDLGGVLNERGCGGEVSRDSSLCVDPHEPEGKLGRLGNSPGVA